MNNEKDFPAVFTAHTPSGPVHCCVTHARQIERLMRMLGAHVNCTKAPDGAQCANCLNEAKADIASAQIRPVNCGTGHCSCIECLFDTKEQ